MAQYKINKYAYALYLELTFTLISQNTPNNTSVVRVLGRVVGTGNGEGSYGGAGRTGTITFNGVTESFNSGKDYNFPNATAVNHVLFQKDYTVAHNTDGTKSVSGSITWKHDNAYLNSNAGTNTASVSITNQALTTIPRYATITSFTASINDLSANLSWTADRTISQYRMSWDSGSTYPSGWITVNAKSATNGFSVSPGSTYGMRIQVKDSASGLITTSSVVTKTATKTPSTLSLSTTSQNVGSGITWTINKSYNYTHKITYAFGNTSGYILGSNSAASNNATGTWTVPIALANQIPNATSGVGTIYVYTYYGSTHIGTKTYSFTAKVPNNATFQPTATISSIVQGVALPAGVTVYVQNKSKVKVTSTGTGKYSSTIRTYSVSVAGTGTYTGSVITSDFLRNSGTVRVTLTVTDSRGLKGSTYQDINVAAYSPPQIPTFKAARSESTPTNISISYNASVSSVSSQNGVHYRIRSLASGGSWGVTRNVTTGYTSSESFTITSDPDKTYTIEIYVADKWTSVTQTVQVGTAFTLIDFNDSGKGMAIGKVSENDSFEVAMPATFTSGITSDGGGNISPSTTAYSYTNGILVDICPASLQKMVFVDVIGHGYTGDLPIRSIFQVYHYEPFGTFLAQRQTNLSGNLQAGKFLIDGNRLKLWFPQSGVYQTITVRAHDQGGVPYKVSISNRAEPSVTYKTTCSLNTTWNSYNSNVMVEQGSNANGRYVRFSDGTQICWLAKTQSLSFSMANNKPASGYEPYLASYGWTFPASFVTAEYHVSGSASTLTAAYPGAIARPLGWMQTGRSTTSCLLSFEHWWNYTSTHYMSLMAIGRWK